MRIGYYTRLNKINDVSRIAKSNFVITEWIVRGKVWEQKFLKNKENKKQRAKLQNYYKRKNMSVLEMVKTGMLNTKIYKPNEKDFYWLYVFEQEMEGVKLTVVLPYTVYKDIIGIDEKDLEQTEEHVDSISIEGKRVGFFDQRNKLEKFSFRFIMDNLEKSKNKLISKMEEVK